MTYRNLGSVRLFAVVLAMGHFALLLPPNRVARAAQITVTSIAGTSGGPDCTLRDAITAANSDTATGGCQAGSGADTIVLENGATYTLTQVDNTTVQNGTALPNGLPSVTSEITIKGNGAVITRASGYPPFRLLHVAPSGRLILNDVTLTNGLLPNIPTTQPGPGADGGGIFNAGVLTLVNVEVTANSAGNTQPIDGPADPAAGCAGRGGGVFNAGTLTLTASTVRLNRAGSNAPGDEGGKCAGAGGGIYNETAATLTLNSSTVSGNSAGSDVDYPGGDGGGIFNAGTFVVNRSTITSNGSGSSGNDYGGNGGGIANIASGTAELIDSTVSSNQAGDGDAGGAGGGIFNSGVLTLTRCTVSGNVAGGGTGGGNGGGIANGVGVSITPSGGTVTLVNSTVSGNQLGYGESATGGGGGIFNTATLMLLSSTVAANGGGSGQECVGGVAGIRNAGGALVVENSLIAANVFDGSRCGGTVTPSDCDGTLASQGFNLIQDTSHCTIAGGATGDILGVDPHLGPLQDNGGATTTQALLPGSSAIGAGNPHGCVDANGKALTTDQRGAPRPVGARCDIGAYEVSQSPTATSGGGGCSTTPPQSGSAPALVLLAFPAALLFGNRRKVLNDGAGPARQRTSSRPREVTIGTGPIAEKETG